MKRSEDFFKAVEEKSNISKQLQEEIVERIYRASKGLTVEPTVTEPTPAPSWLARNAKYLVLAFSLVVLVFTLTGCAKSHETLSIEPVMPKDAVVEKTIVAQPVDVVVEKTIETQPEEPVKATPTPSVKPTTKVRIPTPKSSKTPPVKNVENSDQLTPAQMLVKYPPTIGATVPWYRITPEQAGKAYTDVKPYEVGLTYALYQIGNDMLYIQPRWGEGGTVTWDSVLSLNVDVKAVKVTELVKDNLGLLLIIMEWCDSDGCGIVSYRTDVDLSKLAQLDPTLKQTWGPTKAH